MANDTSKMPGQPDQRYCDSTPAEAKRRKEQEGLSSRARRGISAASRSVAPAPRRDVSTPAPSASAQHDRTVPPAGTRTGHPILTRPSEVRALLTQLDFHPSRILGQNFLIDRNILNILLDAAALQPADTVVEVGPGLGVLTDALLSRAAAVAAVEKDHRLAAYLRERFADSPGLTLHEADILDCDLPALFPRSGLKLVANLPYAIAARLLVDLTAISHPPALIVVTIQREVAARLGAAPSSDDYGLLSILLQRHFAISTVKHIAPACFWPPPEVQSSIARLELRPEPLGGPADELALRGLLRHAFSHRRKTLARSLRDLAPEPRLALAAAGIAPTARAEEIPAETWPALFRALALQTDATAKPPPLRPNPEPDAETSARALLNRGPATRRAR